MATSYTIPRVHSLWETLLELSLSKSDNPQDFVNLWSIAVEPLFDTTDNHKYLGLLLANASLPLLESRQFSVILTPLFMRCLTQHLSIPKHILNKASKYTLSLLVSEAKKDPQTVLALVGTLQGAHGISHFDQRTGTKAVASLLASLNPEYTEKYTEELFKKFYATPKGEESDLIAFNQRCWVVDQLISIARGKVVPKKEQCILRILKFLFYHSVFNYEQKATKGKSTPKKTNDSLTTVLYTPCTPSVTPKLRQFVRTRLLSLITFLNLQPSVQEGEEDTKTKNPNGTTQDGQFWVYKLYLFKQLMTSNPNNTLVQESYEMTEKDEDEGDNEEDSEESSSESSEENKVDVQEVEKKLLTTVNKMQSQLTTLKKSKKAEASKKIKQLKSYESLLLNLGLLTNFGDNGVLATLDELISIYTETFENAELFPVTIVMDILISLLDRGSRMVRRIVQDVFHAFCSFINLESLELLLSVVTEDNDGKDEDDHDHENCQDPTHNHGHKHDHGSDDSDSESEDEDDDDDEEEESKSDESKPESMAVEKSEGEEEDDEDISLDDEAMFRLDKSLAAMVHNSKEAAKELKEIKTSSLHFKHRVVSLLSTFAKSQANNPLILNMISPLLTVTGDEVGSESSNFVSKTRKVLFTLLHSHKYPKGLTSEYIDLLHNLLSQSFTLLFQSQSYDGSVVFSTAITFILRVLLGQSEGGENANWDVKDLGKLDKAIFLEHFTKAVSYFVGKKGKVPSFFFEQLFNHLPKIGWLSLELISQQIGKGSNVFIAFSLLECVKKIIRVKKLHGENSNNLRTVAPFLKDMFMKFFQMERMNGKYAKESLKLLSNILTLLLTSFESAEVRSMVSSEELLAAIDEMCSKKALSGINFSANKTNLTKLLEQGLQSKKRKRTEKQEEEKKEEKIETKEQQPPAKKRKLPETKQQPEVTEKKTEVTEKKTEVATPTEKKTPVKKTTPKKGSAQNTPTKQKTQATKVTPKKTQNTPSPKQKK
eukprot:TRINITY_DN5185_c0_g1_i5.p1 TRINITY_DN5185_c0_g1~~TRINITY_DN5185_c0_g1_i5.p1  ORF type:complete len:995 (-),score=314.34 TRINITY_DN5185_c0_g1_i5:59-3043(-)